MSGPHLPIGAALFVYTQQHALDGRLGQVFDEVRAAGYDGVELFGRDLPDEATAAQVAALLAARGLRLLGVYVGGRLFEPEEVDRTASEVEALLPRLERFGNPPLLVGVRPKGRGVLPHERERKSEAELAFQAEQFNRLGRLARAAGVRLLCHNHDWEINEGERELESIWRATDPALVGFCIDQDWVVRGGSDVFDLWRRRHSRIEYLHLRDYRVLPGEGHRWVEALGDGEFDFSAFLGMARADGYTGPLVVELALEFDGSSHWQRTTAENLARSRHTLGRALSPEREEARRGGWPPPPRSPDV